MPRGKYPARQTLTRDQFSPSCGLARATPEHSIHDRLGILAGLAKRHDVIGKPLPADRAVLRDLLVEQTDVLVRCCATTGSLKMQTSE